MKRLFLDANVLFSAAWKPGHSGVVALWEIENVELVTSDFALEEARRNLGLESQQAELDRLIQGVKVVPSPLGVSLPPAISLPDKDIPILAAALASGCRYLITGDVRHFGDLMGRRVLGLVVLTPGRFMRERHCSS